MCRITQVNPDGSPVYNCNRQSWAYSQDPRIAVRDGDLFIDARKDVPSAIDSWGAPGQQELWNFIQERKITHLLYVGDATNMCVINREYGMIQMRRLGVNTAIVRDLTTAVTFDGYNPDTRKLDPAVTPAVGTAKVVEYIEKRIGPSLDSQQIKDHARRAAGERPTPEKTKDPRADAKPEVAPDASAHLRMGIELMGKGKVKEAIASYRKAIELDPNRADAHNHLGRALYRSGKGKAEEAVTCFRKAIELDPKYADAHYRLGDTLYWSGQGPVDEAVKFLRKAIELDPKHDAAYTTLGAILCDVKREYDKAIACFRKAIELDPKNEAAHHNLGVALSYKNQLDEAIASFRKAIELDPTSAHVYHHLGYALQRKGEDDEAIACFRKAIELKPKSASAHNILGYALLDNSQLDEAIACFRTAIKLDPKDASARRGLARAERLAAVRDRFPAFQNGSYTPASNAERIELAEWCHIKKLHHTATRLYADTFATDPKLADDLEAVHRYNAACEAALAAAGVGEEAAKLDDLGRSRLRQQALDWLRADLALHTKQLASGQAADRAKVQKKLQHWQKDTDLAGIRDTDALAKLPGEERTACERLWADVASLLTKAEAPAPTDGKR
jgi:tetratricopeptide (TPR) repeat protein